MSGGNTNLTLAHPGSTWQLFWTDGLDDFQLDIVGFLAILGEGSILANAQVAALSRITYLPRLMPAPQALLWPSRPDKLPSSPAIVTAVHSGNVRDNIHHVAEILLEHRTKPFTVRCVSVKKRRRHRDMALVNRFWRGLRRQPETSQADASVVRAKGTGPLAIITVLGFTLSVLLFIGSITFGDGWSLLATIMLSFLSTLIGIGNKWTLQLPTQAKGSRSPPGDVVIRWASGNFLVVRCEEIVARELYFAPEVIGYNVKSVAVYRLISLLGTLMLMMGVIALANSRLQLQLAWGAAYVLMNVAHWTVAALPRELHWDLSCYEITEESIEGGPCNESFTDALWKVILVTKDTRWVRLGKAAPQTEVWDAWLALALDQAKSVGHRKGPLVDALWSGSDAKDEGVVWEVPRDWNAKDTWNDLFDRAQRADSSQDDTIDKQEKSRLRPTTETV